MRLNSEKSARLAFHPLQEQPSSLEAENVGIRRPKVPGAIDCGIEETTPRAYSTSPENRSALRARVIRDLRAEGYRLKEIAELLGITIQRVSQILKGR